MKAKDLSDTSIAMTAKDRSDTSIVKVSSGVMIDKNPDEIICNKLSEAFCPSNVADCNQMCNVIMASSLVARR